MPLIASSYEAPWWLPGGHLQTIVPARVMRAPRVAYRRERWDTHDSDFIDLDFALPEPLAAMRRFWCCFMAWREIRRATTHARRCDGLPIVAGAALVVHFRGCSGEANRLPRAYHSGDSDEGDWILRAVHARWPAAPLHAVGVSLGGNMLAKWAGEREGAASFVTAAASIGSPLDLAAGGEALGRGFNLFTRACFLATLKSKALSKLHRFPELARDSESDTTLACKPHVYEFDNEYTAPLHGFRDTDGLLEQGVGQTLAASHAHSVPRAQCAQRSVCSEPPACRSRKMCPRGGA